MSRFTELEEVSELEKSTELKKPNELKETGQIMSPEQAMLILPVVAHFRHDFTEQVQSPVVTLLQWQVAPDDTSSNPPVTSRQMHSSDKSPDECSRFKYSSSVYW